MHGLGLSSGREGEESQNCATLSSPWKPGLWDGPGGRGLAQGPSIRDNTGLLPWWWRRGGGPHWVGPQDED